MYSLHLLLFHLIRGHLIESDRKRKTVCIESSIQMVPQWKNKERQSSAAIAVVATEGLQCWSQSKMRVTPPLRLLAWLRGKLSNCFIMPLIFPTIFYEWQRWARDSVGHMTRRGRHQSNSNMVSLSGACLLAYDARIFANSSLCDPEGWSTCSKIVDYRRYDDCTQVLFPSENGIMIRLNFFFSSPAMFDGMLQVSTKPHIQTEDFTLTSQPMCKLAY